MAGKGLILSGKGGAGLPQLHVMWPLREGGREGAVRWLVRGSQGLVGMFAWRECERESLLVQRASWLARLPQPCFRVSFR